MKVLVTGAGGFIASAIVESLLTAGCEVVACARSPRNIPTACGVVFRQVDFREYRTKADWLPLLDGVDVVVNGAGILREARVGDFALIHDEVPRALAGACIERGVQAFIQISALGSPADGGFITSKHRFDDWLARQSLASAVLRPSVVVSTRGSYGGTSMLRALAGLPWVLVLPGRGDQRIQPVLLEDLAGLVTTVAQQPAAGSRMLYAVGPEVLTIGDYLLCLRAWLKFPPPRVVHLPTSLVRLGAWLGQRLGAGPLGETIVGMLERGNVAPEGAYDALVEGSGYRPGSVSACLERSASFVQDRWQARLYLLAPLSWLVLVVVWIVSGIAGFLAEPADFLPLLGSIGVSEAVAPALVVVTSTLDIVLGLALLLRRRIRLVLALMLVSVVGYTGWLGVMAPALWLEPLGALLKNLPLIPLLLIAMVLEDRR